MATTARHLEISDKFPEHARSEFEEGDLLQASEKIWGAVAHYVKSVAAERGWPNRSHADVRRNAYRMADLTDDPEQNRLLFHYMENLHVNFYEDTYADSPEVIEQGIRHARALIDALKTAEARLR